MSKEYYVMEDAQDIIQWNEDNAELMELSIEDANLILSEVSGHGAELMSDSFGTLYWKEEGHDLLKMTLGDVIDQVCDWNYREINACLDERMNAKSHDHFWEIDAKYKKLKEKEERLNQLFDRTPIGGQIRNRMRDLAEKTMDQIRLIPVINNTEKREEPVAKPVAFQRRPQRGMVM